MAPRNAFKKKQEPDHPIDPEEPGWNFTPSSPGTPAVGWAGADLPEPPAKGTTVPAAAELASSHAHIEGIPTANWQAQVRKKDTRQRERARKLPLLPLHKKALTKYAGKLNVPERELARYLLEFGLDQVEQGNLQFEPRLAQNGLTLYPQEKKTRKTRRGNPDLQSTTCRGIPDEIWDGLKNLAQNYPLWQVINKLLEFGIEQLESGQLILKPKHSGIQTLY
jgi:hypothetical protein